MKIQPAAHRLISLLRLIATDGTITADEAYELADFLNGDDEAANCWPGNTLFPVVADVWKDGVTEPGELQGLLEVLRIIEHDWCNLRLNALEEFEPEPSLTA